MALSTNGRRPVALDTGPTREEAEDDALQQVAPPGDVPRVQVLSPGFIRAVHPDHGEAVTFTPGEALPAWLVPAVLAGDLTVGPDGVLHAKGA